MVKKRIREKTPIWKVVLSDIAGVSLLILVPFLGPLPGPGGIPLLLAGLGLLAMNHDWADRWLHYAKIHSESLRHVFFPDTTWVKWAWDIFAAFMLGFGTWVNIIADENWFWKGISIGIMAGSTTVFMMNRNRITWLDKKIRPGSYKYKDIEK